MQNRPLENTVYVLTAGAFGVFLRWLQLQLAFDDKGLCGPSIFNYIVPLFILVAAYVLRRRIWQMLSGELVLPTDYHEALANPGRFYAFLRWMAGLLMAAGGALVIRGSDVEKQKLLLRQKPLPRKKPARKPRVPRPSSRTLLPARHMFASSRTSRATIRTG